MPLHNTQYQHIEKAIHYIANNVQNQPSLEDVANYVGLSPYYLQKMFTEWAGVSPKKFLQYLSLSHAKKLLKEDRATVLHTAYETGLSGGGRLHDLFVNIECMTPGEFKLGGKGLNIRYCFASSPFGNLIVASTYKGVCFISFESDEALALQSLKLRFPNALCQKAEDDHQQSALRIFQRNWQNLSEVKLHLAGTPFQLKVWESLLHIPLGALNTYGQIANNIHMPKAARAVGSAIGSNPIAFLIPCHRVIQSSGKLGGYMWGETRKQAIIGWEAAQTEQ